MRELEPLVGAPATSADLTGESLSWLDAPALPTEKVLLKEFLAWTAPEAQDGELNDRSPGSERLHGLLDMAGVRGATMVLEHPGHGNHLGLLSLDPQTNEVGIDPAAIAQAIAHAATALRAATR